MHDKTLIALLMNRLTSYSRKQFKSTIPSFTDFTIPFIQNIDGLFDFLNSRHPFAKYQ